jgi:phosphatidylethanolamine-binding protein (PEBP) family uncharacterized protein
MLAYVELALSYLFKNAKERDAKSFYTSPAFASCPDPTIPITSPDCGPSPAVFGNEYISDTGDTFPTLEWTAEGDLASKVKEWVLVVEDPDAPLPTPICHG